MLFNSFTVINNHDVRFNHNIFISYYVRLEISKTSCKGGE